MDSRVNQLLSRFPEAVELDDPFAELNEEENNPESFYDRLIVNFAQGDIVKGLEIMEKVTLVQALTWLLMRQNNE